MIYKEFTFFWNKSWLEVQCQYSKVPPEWHTIIVFFIVEFDGVLAIPVTADLSSFIRLYWIYFFVGDKILVVPSKHPKHIRPEVGRYSLHTAGLSKVISISLMK